MRRRRGCDNCGARFTTFERVQLREIMVVKRDGKRVPFQREKLARVIAIALRKRPVSSEQIDQIVSGVAVNILALGMTVVIANALFRHGGHTPALAMESLRVVDPVGYVRYASVYRDFDAPSDFAAFIKQSELDED